MKIVVNNNRTVHIATSAGVAQDVDANGDAVPNTGRRPTVRACGPGSLLDLPTDEAKRLIARGFAREYEPPNPLAAPEPPLAA